MCLQFSVMGDECFWSWGPPTSFLQRSPSHAVCSVTWRAASPSWRRSAVVWAIFFSAQLFCIFSGEKITDWVFFFMTCSSHMGRVELMYCSLRTLSLRVFPKFSGRSFAAGYRPPGRGDVAVGLICVFILRWKLLAMSVIWLTLRVPSRSAEGDASWHQWSKFTSCVASCTADASRV